MAKGYSHKFVKSETITIKGTLSDSADVIVYQEDKQDKVANIQDCLNMFAGEVVTFSIGVKSDEEIDEDETE